MKHTNREITIFINTASDWQNKETAKKEKKESHDLDSKFAYAVRKVLKKAVRAYEHYQEEIEDINIEHCAADEKNIILRDPPTFQNAQGAYRFTKEEMKLRMQKIRALQDNLAEIEPHFASDIPASVTDDQRENMIGFVIKEEKTKLEVVA